MGRKLKYQPGSYYLTDDRTGFPQRAGRMRKEWTGALVDQSVWEPRQPQDLVKGRADYQGVPEARPLSPNVFTGPWATTLSADVGPDVAVLPVTSTAGFAVGDAAGVIQNDGSTFRSTVQALDAGALTITLASPCPLGAPSGNEVIDFKAAVR